MKIDLNKTRSRRRLMPSKFTKMILDSFSNIKELSIHQQRWLEWALREDQERKKSVDGFVDRYEFRF